MGKLHPEEYEVADGGQGDRFKVEGLQRLRDDGEEASNIVGVNDRATKGKGESGEVGETREDIVKSGHVLNGAPVAGDMEVCHMQGQIWGRLQ